MANSARARADILLAATRLKEKPVLNEEDEKQRASAEKVARLKALRLAKEAADKKAAAGKEKPVRLPQAHRGRT